MNSIMGHFNTGELGSSSAGPLGAIMFVVYEMLLVNIWLNILVVIICDVHAEVGLEKGGLIFFSMVITDLFLYKLC